MDKERIVRLNEILREVSARNRPIDDLDETPDWFAGMAEAVAESVNEVRTLFDEAYESGLINKGTYESGHGPCTHWDWTTTAHRRALLMGITLINPMGDDDSDEAQEETQVPMDDGGFMRLNEILRQASERHPITKYDDCPGWFQGPDEENVYRQVTEFALLFGEGVRKGFITTWTEPGDSSHPTYWNWSVKALEKARELSISLADPLGGRPLFSEIPNFIAPPTEMVQDLSIGKLDNDLCQYVNRVYQEQVRYVITHDGKPVAALVPVIDLEMLRDVQADTEPCEWLEWVQDVRERVGWPAVTFNEEEK